MRPAVALLIYIEKWWKHQSETVNFSHFISFIRRPLSAFTDIQSTRVNWDNRAVRCRLGRQTLSKTGDLEVDIIAEMFNRGLCITPIGSNVTWGSEWGNLNVWGKGSTHRASCHPFQSFTCTACIFSSLVWEKLSSKTHRSKFGQILLFGACPSFWYYMVAICQEIVRLTDCRSTFSICGLALRPVSVSADNAFVGYYCFYTQEIRLFGWHIHLICLNIQALYVYLSQHLFLDTC